MRRLGLSGTVWWLRGAGTAFVISILFYLFGAAGAGDVKLLSAAAGFLGMESLGILFAGTLLIGGGGAGREKGCVVL